MADEDKTIKVTFVGDTKSLDESFAKANKQASTFGTLFSKVSSVTSRNKKEQQKLDSKMNSPSTMKATLESKRAVLATEKAILKTVQQQNTAYSNQKRLLSQLATAGGRGQGAGIGGTGVPGTGAGPGPGGGKRGFGSRLKGLLGGLGGFALKGVAATGGLLAGAVGAQMRQGYAAYTDYATNLAQLAGTGATNPQMARARAKGVGYGYGPSATAAQARQAAIETGYASSVTTAQMLSRGTSLDVNQATGLLGTLTRAGTGFGGGTQKGNQELKKIIALGFESGIADARIPEFIQGVEQVVEAQGARQGGVVSAADFANVLQAMGETGAPGLQGARGAAVLQQLNEAIVHPGGGEAGQALVSQAMGFGKPGGNTSYYEAVKMQERGATPQNIARLFRETRGQFGGGEEQILGLREITGLTASVLEQLEKAARTLEGPKRDQEIERILKEARPAEERAADSMKEVGFHAERIAILQNRLTNIGELEYAAITDIQDGINTIVDQLLPVAIPALNAIAKPFAWLSNKQGPGTASYEDVPDKKAKTSSIWEGFDSMENFMSSMAGLKTLRRDDFDIADLPAFRERMTTEQIKAAQHLIGQTPGLADEVFAAVKTPGRTDDDVIIDKFLGKTELAARLAEIAQTNKLLVEELKRKATGNGDFNSVDRHGSSGGL